MGQRPPPTTRWYHSQAFGIDRLAHRAQQLQGFPGGSGHQIVALAHELPNGCRCGVEDVDAVLVHYLPAPRCVRPGGHAFEHERGGAVGERSVDDVGVTGDPADIGGAPVDVPLVIVEYVLVGHRRMEEIPRRTVLYALGPAGGTGGVENEQGILRGHRFRLAGRRLVVGEIVVPDIPSVDPGHLRPRAFHGHDGMHAGALGQRRLGIVFERHGAAAAYPLVRRDDRLTVGIENAVFQRLRGESTEDHGMDGADARAGKHRVGRLGNHGHVDAYPVALRYAAGAQPVRQPADRIVQLPVGYPGVVAGVVAFPDDGCLFRFFRQVPVDAVVAGVEGAAVEPAHGTVRHVGFENRLPALVPVQEDIRLFGPEPFGVFHGPGIHGPVLIVVEVGALRHGRIDRIAHRLPRPC